MFGLDNAKNSKFKLKTDGCRDPILTDMLSSIELLDFYRSLLDQEKSLRNRDRNQLFFLRNSNPKNHMPALCIFNNHHKPLSKGLLPETYGFI